MLDENRVLTVERSTSTAHRLSEYEGVCGQIHGHNIHWSVEAVVSMDNVGSSNMPLDLKDISSLIDDVDHASVLSANDDLVQFVTEHHEMFAKHEFENQSSDEHGYLGVHWLEPVGDVHIFDTDPTCEMLSDWMANRIADLPNVEYVDLTAYETNKYGIRATAGTRPENHE